jgi:tRNA threonylcarbamoyladenosine biosynthesis protein TsaB
MELMYKILALETATEACSVALSYKGKIYQRFEHQPQQQAGLILPMIDAVLEEAGVSTHDLDALAFSCGPGSFTGLRVAAAVTQGIAVATGLPVVPVSTLALLAQGIYIEYGKPAVLTALDARMQEVYWACYRLNTDGLMQAVGDEIVVAPADVPLPAGSDWAGAGSGWRAYPEVLAARLQSHVSESYAGFWPQAAHMLPLADALFSGGVRLDAAAVAPVYIRNQVAQTKAARNSQS